MEESKYLLAVDPGLASGISLFDITDPVNPVLVWYSEMSIAEFYEQIPALIEKYSGSLQVVCENFIITLATAKKSPAPWSLNLIGILQYFCWVHSVEMTLQKPEERKFATDEKIKALGFVFKRKNGHVTESVRHAIVWMVHRNGKLAKRLIV